MIDWCLFTAYFIWLIWLIWKKLADGKEVDVLPSIGWCSLMVLPFMGQRHTLSAQHLSSQSLGIFLFGFTILLADQVCSRSIRRISFPFSERSLSRFTWCLVAFVIALQIWHVLSMPKIPLLESFRISDSQMEDRFTLLRERSSKLLSAPDIFKYMFQASLSMFAPLAILLLYQAKRYAPMAGMIVLCIIYSKISLARGPILYFILICIVMYYSTCLMPKRRMLLKCGGAILLLPTLYCAYFLFFHPGSALNRRIENPQNYVRHEAVFNLIQQPFTIADHCRIGRDESLSSTQRTINTLFYRLILGPVDVSHRWYIYYPDVYRGYVGFDGLTPSTRHDPNFIHPSTRVGRWAYVHRFPESYWPSINAYGSIDADSYARWGVQGQICVAIFIFLFRVSAGWLRLKGSFGDALHATVAVILGAMLPMASLPAALIVQGALFFWLIAPIACIVNRWRFGSWIGNAQGTDQ